MKRDRKKSEKFFIFDFDGTIADTKSIYYKIVCDELKRFGYSYKDIDKAIDSGLSLKGVLKKLGFSGLSVFKIKRKIMKRIIKNLDGAKKCKDVASIKDIKTKKILVSNSYKKAILPILKHYEIKKYFKEIHGAEDFSDKAEFIKKYIKKNKLNRQKCYYIGDRVADVKVAKRLGCLGVIICGKCAWDSQEEVLKQKPDFIVGSIRDLKKLL